MNSGISSDQKQTESTFGFKWQKRATYESASVQKDWADWLFLKYFDNDRSKLDKILSGGRKRILDAGCGSGGSASLLFGDNLKDHDYFGVDISNAVDVAKVRFQERGLPGHFVQSDLNKIPAELGSFDVIFSEGVLHHTDSVKKAIKVLSDRLLVGGKFLFYVYRKKAPIREYTDDLIREAIAPLDNEQAWKALEPLTKLGKTLGDLNIDIDVDEDIPYLDIPKGKYNLQRLFYYKVCKAYYRDNYSVDEMNHINFDWFRPKNCFRHTPEEIESFLRFAGLKVDRLYLDESGITVIASKLA